MVVVGHSTDSKGGEQICNVSRMYVSLSRTVLRLLCAVDGLNYGMVSEMKFHLLFGNITFSFIIIG